MRTILAWVIPIVVLAIALGVFLFGYTSPMKSRNQMATLIADDKSGITEQLIETWDEVDEFFQDCSKIGVILRSIEAKDEYTYRAFLVVPQSSDEGLILANDGGQCWLNGKKGRPKLDDPGWFLKAFAENKIPVSPQDRPFQNTEGIWSIAPVKDQSRIWGLLLLQKPAE